MTSQQRPIVTPLLVLLGAMGAMSLLGCGGGSSTGTPPNPGPAVAALSPNSSQQGGPAFTLSVVGSNFISGSSVQWNGSSLATTFVSSALLTADVPASAVAGPGADAVRVVNPAPGGGASAALNFAVPCGIPLVCTRLCTNPDSPRCLLFRRLVWSADQLSLPGSALGPLSRSPTLLRMAGQFVMRS